MIGTPSPSQTAVLGEWRPPPSVAIFQFRVVFLGAGIPTIGTSGPAATLSVGACCSHPPNGATTRIGMARRGSAGRVRTVTAAGPRSSALADRVALHAWRSEEAPPAHGAGVREVTRKQPMSRYTETSRRSQGQTRPGQ